MMKKARLNMLLYRSIKIWKSVKKNANVDELLNKNKTEKFSPHEFYGILSDLNLDIEHELQNMKDQWKRDF